MQYVPFKNTRIHLFYLINNIQILDTNKEKLTIHFIVTPIHAGIVCSSLHSTIVELLWNLRERMSKQNMIRLYSTIKI